MTDHSIPEAGLDEGILDTLYLLSQLYHSRGLYEPASQLLAFLLRRDPARASLHFALGKAQHAQSRHDTAVVSYRRALALGLSAIDVHLYLGQCLMFLAKPDQAARALRQFIALASLQPDAPGLALQLHRAGHLLNHVVLPRLPPESAPGVDLRALAGALGAEETKRLGRQLMETDR